MATYTTNLNLKKPAQSDKIRIADINNNMDDIDAAFGPIGNDSVATQIGNIQGALAIVSVGDSHAAITAGQYVYVKSHETLDTGLYVASANIAQNGALSSSNLTADTAGGLNVLNGNITPTAATGTPTSIITINTYNRFKRVGRIIILSLNFPISGASGINPQLFTNLVAPDSAYEMILANDTNAFRATLNTSGVLAVDGSAPPDGWYAGTLTYISAS